MPPANRLATAYCSSRKLVLVQASQLILFPPGSTLHRYVFYSLLPQECILLRGGRRYLIHSPAFLTQTSERNRIWYSSNVEKTRTNGAAPASALAHELGHYLDLCAIDGAAPWAFHSAADQKVASNDQKIRDDSVTRRRLLYPYISLPAMATKAWRNNVGYGNSVTGCMVSSRQLSQDVTLDETVRARTAAGSGANLYAP